MNIEQLQIQNEIKTSKITKIIPHSSGSDSNLALNKDVSHTLALIPFLGISELGCTFETLLLVKISYTIVSFILAPFPQIKVKVHHFTQLHGKKSASRK